MASVKKAKGSSLIEVLVALVLFAMITGIAASILVSVNQKNDYKSFQARQLVRYSMCGLDTLMRRDTSNSFGLSIHRNIDFIRELRVVHCMVKDENNKIECQAKQIK